MDQSQVRKIVNDNVERMLQALQLRHWKIEMVYGPLPDTCYAMCKPNPQNRLAEITMDPTSFDNEIEVLETFRHELLHILNADFETYRKTVCQLVEDKEFHALDEMFTYATESLIWRLERMFDYGLEIDVKRLCEELRGDNPVEEVEPDAN